MHIPVVCKKSHIDNPVPSPFWINIPKPHPHSGCFVLGFFFFLVLFCFVFLFLFLFFFFFVFQNFVVGENKYSGLGIPENKFLFFF